MTSFTCTCHKASMAFGLTESPVIPRFPVTMFTVSVEQLQKYEFHPTSWSITKLTLCSPLHSFFSGKFADSEPHNYSRAYNTNQPLWSYYFVPVGPGYWWTHSHPCDCVPLWSGHGADQEEVQWNVWENPGLLHQGNVTSSVCLFLSPLPPLITMQWLP